MNNNFLSDLRLAREKHPNHRYHQKIIDYFCYDHPIQQIQQVQLKLKDISRTADEIYWILNRQILWGKTTG